MTLPTTSLDHLPDLVQSAQKRLAAALAGDGRVPIADQPLAALMRVAADPQHATDALMLLHELQVQQIELEMQLEELRRGPAESPGA
jgi:hypothetical protein